MKTVKEASKEYAESLKDNDYTIETESAFLAGIEFAQRWISVEEELPPTINNEGVFLIEPILTKYNDNPVVALSTFSNIGTYTKWRPIERS